MTQRRMILSIVCLIGVTCPCAFSQESGSAFPMKTDRMLYSDEEIQLARDNIKKYPSARSIADKIISSASEWLDWSDEDLRKLITTADVPRAFSVGTAGCPICGDAIYKTAGSYPWIIDPRIPFKVQCPNCKSIFPGNDFEAYYRSGFQDKRYLEGDFSDDGWGWVGPPDNHRYWFVAYANHWSWLKYPLAAVQCLGQAYLLTGEPRFAHKAVVLLDRIAEVYPAMDYHTQSRYGYLQGSSRYEGKIINRIWETEWFCVMAECYDAVWETIDGDLDLHAVTGKSGQEIRSNIEIHLLEEGIGCYFNGKMRGNYGMHQRALIRGALSRQYGNLVAWLDEIFKNSGAAEHLCTGLDYALYNLVYRDGYPYESAPHYCWLWVSHITSLAETLKKTDRNFYETAKVKRLYDAPLDMTNIGRFTPSLGDSGSVYGGRINLSASVYQSAYRAYRDARYLDHLASFNATGDAGFQSFDTLFYPPIVDESETISSATVSIEGEGSERALPPQRSRLLDGCGIGILNNPKDTISISLYYGFRGGHGHFDRLHFDLFAGGQPMMPDLGYPDFMNDYIPGIYTWSKNTINHNTTTVDAGRQRENQAGTVHLFADCPFARVIDVDAPETYPVCSVYRRHLVMVDVSDNASYFVDFFTVKGGGQHDYSLHGPPGEFRLIGGSWSEPARGTLAGEHIALGEIYDHPALAAEGYTGGYSGYLGSGFQHLVNVQRHLAGDWIAEYAHEKDPSAKLRIHILDQADQEIILADAQVSPITHLQLIKYVIARRAGESLDSLFMSVLEPFSNGPLIKTVASLRFDRGDGAAVRVHRQNGETDLVLYDPSGSDKILKEYDLRTDARSAVLILDNTGTLRDAFFAGGSVLSIGERRYGIPAPPKGIVTGVDPEKEEIRVRLTGGSDTFDPGALVGGVVHFVNSIRRTAHMVDKAVVLNGNELILSTRDDLLVGRAHLTEVDPAILRTNSAFQFAPVYRGTMVSDLDLSRYYRVRAVASGAIHLVDALPADHPFRLGDDVWLVNVGPGDQLDITPQWASVPNE